MTQARRATVQRRPKKRIGAVQVHNSVTAGDVERQAGVQLETLGGNVGRDAGVVVVKETRWLDDEPLDGPRDGGDWVGVVGCIEE